MTPAQIEQMRSLKDAGYSYASIGSLFGVSRQRIHQLTSNYGLIRVHGRYRLLRNIVLSRDGHKCQTCGESTNLLVHHIDGNDRNNDLVNLTTLCRRCHLCRHRQRSKHQSVRDMLIRARGGPNKHPEEVSQQLSMTNLVEHQSKVAIIQGVNRQLRKLFIMRQGNDGENQKTVSETVGAKPLGLLGTRKGSKHPQLT